MTLKGETGRKENLSRDKYIDVRKVSLSVAFPSTLSRNNTRKEKTEERNVYSLIIVNEPQNSPELNAFVTNYFPELQSSFHSESP
jgi:hypothetical protein